MRLKSSAFYTRVTPSFHNYVVRDAHSDETIEFDTMEFANPTALCVKAKVKVTGNGLAPIVYSHTYWMPHQKKTNAFQLLEFYLKGGDAPSFPSARKQYEEPYENQCIENAPCALMQAPLG